MKKFLRLFLVTLAVTLSVAYGAIGAAAYSNTAGLSNTLVQAKVGTCIVCGYNFSNSNTGTVFVQFFDSATTSGITLGTTPPKFSLAIPAGGGVTDGLQTFGPGFTEGVVIAATTTAGGSTAPATAIPITLFFN